MKTFKVTLINPDTWTTYIEANNLEEAEVIAKGIIPGDVGTVQDEEPKEIYTQVKCTKENINNFWNPELS